MKKVTFYLILLFAVVLYSCEKENPVVNPNVTITIDGVTPGGVVNLVQDNFVILKAQVDITSDFSLVWSVNGVEKSNEIYYKYVANEVGEYQVTLKVFTPEGGLATTSFKLMVTGKYNDGTFILNEGNMTSGNGSIVFINPQGMATDSAYWRANGSFLGNSPMDLFITGNKLYVVCQNGDRTGGDGILVVADAGTLQKKAAYNQELSALSWPTHVAVIGDDAYIRDNKGVYKFNMVTKELLFVEGSKGAAKNRMAVIGNKVFVPAGKNLYVIKDGAIIETMAMSGTISGVIKSSDNNIYVSCTTNPATIIKIKASDHSVLQTNTIAEAKVGAGWGASPGISAKGDTLYFSNASTKIYRHIFSKGQTEYMTDVKEHVQNAGIVYNNLAVHPVSGEVYFNTIKGYGLDYLINSISVFNFGKQAPVLKAEYKNLTQFPAGIFFTYDF